MTLEMPTWSIYKLHNCVQYPSYSARLRPWQHLCCSIWCIWWYYIAGAAPQLAHPLAAHLGILDGGGAVCDGGHGDHPGLAGHKLLLKQAGKHIRSKEVGLEGGEVGRQEAWVMRRRHGS